MATEEVDKIAQGRVWSGADAHELGLVDSLGDLDDAITAAAKLADLGDNYIVSYIEKEQAFQDKVLRELMAEAVSISDLNTFSRSPIDSLLSKIVQAASHFTALNDPNHVYVLSNIESD